MHDDHETGNGLEIALIGLACRVPGAQNAEAFWKNLVEGVESITFFDDDELREMGENPAYLAHPDYVRAARVLEGVEDFDAAFFGSSPREAEILDPQQRLFLECAWEALENAGYDPGSYDGLIGVFGGSRLSSYLFNVYSNPSVVESMGYLQLQTANDKDYLATRVAYKLGLEGPAVNVQTACSTALVAAHLACQALLSGECDMALAGGVGIKTPQLGYLYREGEIYSRDGHIRAFDAHATGTIFSHGLGLVVLKRLEDALADGDTIRAVVRGSAVNNDASRKVGFTAPSDEGQARVVRAAHLAAEVDPETITYVEAHGTGTATGDPIEISALTRAFREGTPKTGFCALGSVKTNVGHLGPAAGAASLIKTVLALEHRKLPPSLLFEEPNPQIDFASSPFFVNTELRDWETNGTPRRAGVSSFGIGGTNAHMVLEEAPPAEAPAPPRPRQLLLVSARTETALDAACDRLADHLEAHPEQSLDDVAYTLQRGRRSFEHRRSLLVRDRATAVELLRRRPPKEVETSHDVHRERHAAFLFSGQGSQHPGMGRGLYRAEPVFREAVDRAAEVLDPILDADLRQLIFAATDDEDAAERLRETRFTQPALFVVEYALARQWMAWGVEPEAMLGHSIGEYVAACLAGVFTLEDALKAVSARGRLMQACPPGSMLSVPMSEEALSPLLGPELEISVLNAHDRLTVSGPEVAVDALARRLAGEGVQAKPVATSHAFHSAMMEPALEPFRAELGRMRLEAPRIPFLSNVTGTWIRDEEATDPDYWTLHLRRPVRFADGLGELLRAADRVLIEVGPGRTLAGLVRRHPDRGAASVVSSLGGSRESAADEDVLLRALGKTWLAGLQPDWESFHGEDRRRRVPLPTYPFERRRYWIEMGPGLSLQTFQSGGARPLDDWFYLPHWKPSLLPPSSGVEADEETWLVFDDGGELAAAFGDAGRQVLRVTSGEGFRDAGDGCWELAPGDRDGYSRLFAALSESGRRPSRMVHAWGRDALADDVLDRGFYSVLFLTQAHTEAFPDEDVRLAVVTGGTALRPEKAAVLGPCRVVPREQPHLRVVAVDVDAGEDVDATRLVDELEAAAEGSTVVAWRHGQRWERDYQATAIDRADERRPRLRDEGVYLVTGGLGGFGLTFAEDLARRHRARLVLLGRSGLPERDAWAEWIARHGEADRTSLKIRKVEALEALGAEVMVASADVTDEAAMRDLVGRVRERFGALHGVIHAAGLPGGGLARTKSREEAAAVLAPKVEGTLALWAALDEARDALDFLVLCSSTIAVLGTFGQVDYCAANSFLDAFAESHAGKKPWVVSINWSGWSEVGMAAETQVRAGLPVTVSKSAELDDTLTGAAAHPLLDRTVRGEAAYSSIFAPESHWILDEHRIGDRGTVPGTTYLELARAAFAHHHGLTDGGVELKDVFFYQPLMMDDGDRREVLVALEEEDGDCRFRVSSRSLGEAKWTTHASGHAATADAGGPVHDAAEIRRRCGKEHAAIEGLGSTRLVSWGPRWKCLESVHLGEDEGLAHLRLPDEFHGDLEAGYGLHPALLDVATALTSGLAKGGGYLPLSYRRVTVHRALPASFYSHLRLHDDAAAGDGETVSADVTLFDDDGVELVAIEGFTMKRVGEAAARLQAGGAPAPAMPAADGAGTPAPREGLFASGGMSPQDGAEALRRVLSRLDVPRVVVTNRDLERLLEQNAAALTSQLTAYGAGEKDRYPRPHLSTPYEEPRNELESALSRIWQSVLGLEEVGVHDNFFELGGDSVLGITVIAQARESGLLLTPEQLFNHPTVEELAAALGNGEAPRAPEDTGEVESDGDLAPDQVESILATLESLS